MKRALITGITGQDGSYLADLLLSKGYEVHGMVRRVATEVPLHRFWRIGHLLDTVQLHAATLESFASIMKVFLAVRPSECYHLAAQSYVTNSFEDEHSTFKINIDGTHHVLSALKEVVPECRFYFAASSEMFGNTKTLSQDEETPFNPRSTYGISKLTGFNLTKYYREAYGIHASNGILFNHESPRRGYEFVTRKITRGVAAIKYGMARSLSLGNLDAERDWGHARAYVPAMWLMLQKDNPDDYVVATGETHSVREFCEKAFAAANMDYQEYVEQDEKMLRPADVSPLCGNPSKAALGLGWKPVVTFDQLVLEMVEHDLKTYPDTALRS